MAKKALRQQRLTAALYELPALESELAFEKIAVQLHDDKRHWQFFFGDKHIADYWPASAKGQTIGQAKPVSCASPAQAQKLVIAAKKALIKRIADKLIRKNNGRKTL